MYGMKIKCPKCKRKTLQTVVYFLKLQNKNRDK